MKYLEDDTKFRGAFHWGGSRRTVGQGWCSRGEETGLGPEKERRIGRLIRISAKLGKEFAGWGGVSRGVSQYFLTDLSVFSLHGLARIWQKV